MIKLLDRLLATVLDRVSRCLSSTVWPPTGTLPPERYRLRLVETESEIDTWEPPPPRRIVGYRAGGPND